MLSSPQARPCGEAPRIGEPLATPEIATLGDRDLLAIMLSWVRAEQPDALAADLLERFGSLAQVLVAAPGEILAVNGAGAQVVVLARCAREAGMRLCRDQIDRRPVISSWSQLVDYVRACIAHLPREQFRALYLDRRNILLREELVAEGTVDHAPVYNSGPSRVARLGRVPDIAETRAYVAAVIECYLALTAGRRPLDSRQCGPRSAQGGDAGGPP